MTTEQALQILDNAAGQARLTRNDHIAVQQALDTLRAAIKPADKPAEQPAEKKD